MSPRLPSAEDVPQVRVAQDPGVQAPVEAFQSPLGIAAQELSEPLRIAAVKMQSREDAIEFARAVEDVTLKTDAEVKRFNTERDLSDKNVSAELGGSLTSIQSQALTNFRGSADARTRLEARLIGIQSVYTGQAAEIAATISLKRAETALDGALSPIVEQAGLAASTLGVNGSNIETLRRKIDEANLTWDSRVSDFNGLLDPTQENKLLEAGKSQIANRTLTTLINRGNDDIAEQLLATGLSASLTPQQSQSITQKIADIRLSKSEMSRKIMQAESALGRPLTTEERGQLIGLKESKLTTKEVFNVSTGQLQFATEEQIAANPNLVPKQVGKGDEIKPAQRVAAGFAVRMEDSGKVIDKVGSEFSGLESRISGGFLFPREFKSKDRQIFEQAKRNFTNSVLRRESGAVISPSEFESAELQYFPVSGDTKDVLVQKQQNRNVVTQATKLEAGEAFSQLKETLPKLTVKIKGIDVLVGSQVINSKGQKAIVNQDGSLTIVGGK